MTEDTWTLQSIKIGCEGESRRTKAYEVPKSVAFDQVIRGEARFSKQPVKPPYELLDALNERLAVGVEALGPPLSGPKQVERLQRDLFKNGLRQSVLLGYPIYWHKGLIGLRNLAGIAFSNCAKHPSNLFAELRWVIAKDGLSHIVQSEVDNHDTMGARHSSTALITEWDFLVPKRDEFDGKFDDAWVEFGRAFISVQVRLDELILSALQESRIVVGEEQTAGFAYQLPDTIRDLKNRDALENRWFVATQALPKAWLKKQVPLEARRKEATKWLQRAARHFHGLGRRYSNAVAEEVLVEKFDLSQNAAKQVCQNADRPWKGVTGKIAESQRVTCEDLMEFK